MNRIPMQNFGCPAALARLLIPALIGLGLDLWTKYLAVVHLKASHASIQFFPGWLHWEYTENHGAVFGSGQGLRWLFVTVSILAIAFLLYLFATSGRQRIYQILIGILMAGVLGNLYDRVVYGYVRDMIHALPGWKWPNWMVRLLPEWQWKYQDVFPWIFNVADSLLCIGVTLMILYSLLNHPAAETAPADSEAETARMINPRMTDQ